MDSIERIRNELVERAFKIVEEFPGNGEVSLRLGVNMQCPIVEVSVGDRDEVSGMLKAMGFRIMIRQKDDGIYQFILRN